MTDTAHAAIESALAQFVTPGGDPVLLLRGLMDAVRPADVRDEKAAVANWRALNEVLAARDEYRQAVSAAILELLATRRLLSFFAEEGILPDTGFFSELGRKIVHKLLPELLDEQVFKDCLDAIFHRGHDHLWFNAVPMADKLVFWRTLDLLNAPDRAPVDAFYEQLLDGMLVVSCRITALAFHPELRRVCPEVEEDSSPYRALNEELGRFVDRCRALQADPAQAPEKEERIGPLLVACRMQLSHAFVATLDRGVSLPLTYLLTQLEQLLDRLDLLLGLLATRFEEELSAKRSEQLAGFIRTTLICETQRNSVRKHFSDLMGLLALRITENASRTGEHYIASDWSAYWAMWLSAIGAGLIIPFMALTKIAVSQLALAPSGYAVACSLIYGLGFVLIALLHFTVATKQPAMTAAKIAGAIGTSEGRLHEDQRLVGLIVDTIRSQLAAILGNVLVAMLTASIVAWHLEAHLGHSYVDDHEAHHLLDQIKPSKGLNLVYAAIAGVWLFVAGLLAGYFDNLATYSRVGERLGRLRWLGTLVGRDRARRLGAFVNQNLGSLMGNFLFGCMLGTTSLLGLVLGLKLDIRHVTFSATNLANGLAALHYQVPPWEVLECSVGVALIGFINLAVSFTLALYVALRSRGATLAAVPSLVGHVLQRVLQQPMRALIPPRNAPSKTLTH